ncbi:MAG TPA: DUF4337 domain-containing protein [Armatimonadota bacterium]|jgi:hypothetical protein
MDLDLGTDAGEAGGKGHARLNTLVAIAVALLATFMGICDVKDNNIVQAMQAAQAKSIDDWNWYQARKIREEVARATADELRAMAQASAPGQRPGYAAASARYTAIAAEQVSKEAETKAAADNDQKDYDALNFRDDQFDASSAAIALAIALLAMTALTHKRWLFALSMFPAAFGVLMGLAGILSWRLHPDLLARWLS